MADMDNLTQADRLEIASIQNKGGKPQHLNGSVGTSAIIIDFTFYADQFIIYNSHASQSLSVSFDDGTTWFTLVARGSLSFKNVAAKNIQLKGSNTNTTYEILYL